VNLGKRSQSYIGAKIMFTFFLSMYSHRLLGPHDTLPCILAVIFQFIFSPVHIELTLNVTITAPDTQIDGQSLVLECSVTAVRGITSRVDIIWSSDGTELERMEGANVSSITDNSVVYTDTYNISQLSITDDGREYQCEVMINTSPPVMANYSVTLDVMG